MVLLTKLRVIPYYKEIRVFHRIMGITFKVGLLTKPTSVKFSKEMLADIDEQCEGLGCNRTDFIRHAVEEKLQESTNETEDQEIKPEPKPQIQSNNQVNETEIKKDKPKVIIDLNTDKTIPKAEIVKIIDNSKKPQIEMVEFNGKYIPKAEVYEI